MMTRLFANLRRDVVGRRRAAMAFNMRGGLFALAKLGFARPSAELVANDHAKVPVVEDDRLQV